jgi:protein O-mannosyl-transferase
MTRTRTGQTDASGSGADGPIGRDLTGAWRWALVLFAVAALVAYSNSFRVPFLFDDMMNVVGNFSAKHLSTALFPAPDSVTGGRPLLNLSFALNYAFSQLNVQGYHAVNLCIHIAAALALFGVFRRTLCLRKAGSFVCGHENAIAFFATLIWTVHPIQTEAVTYISQRAESLMALFYLLTFYGFIRAMGSKRSSLWLALSILACLAGALTKELIATVPIAVLFLDRYFIGGSFAAIWRKRKFYYLALSSVWVVLAIAQSGLKRVGVGIHTGVPGWVFAMFSCRTLCRYMKLIFWPRPLILDYGDIPHFMLIQDYLPYVFLIAFVLTLAVVLVLRGNSAGFILLCFFLLLAPTHSFIPLSTQPMAEHRVYLGLACFSLLSVASGFAVLGSRAVYPFTALVLLLASLTLGRNRDYATVQGAWADVVSKMPDNPRAHYALGGGLYLVGRYMEAQREFERTIELAPDFADAYSDLGLIFSERAGCIDKAINLYKTAIRKNPKDLRVHILLGLALKKMPGHDSEAVEQFRTAIEMGKSQTEAALPVAYTELARLLAKKPGTSAEAVALYQAALSLSPDWEDATVGLELLQGPDSATETKIARRIRGRLRDHPDSLDDHYNLAQILAKEADGSPEAISEYEAALKIDPGFADAHNNLGVLLMHAGVRRSEAIAHFQSAILNDPNLAPAYFNLGCALEEQENTETEAIAAFKSAILLDPHNADAHNNLGIALTRQPGRLPEAIDEFQTALRESPGDADARFNLDAARSASPTK